MILDILLIGLLGVPLLLVAGQGLVVIARLAGLVSQSEVATRAEFARMRHEAAMTEPSLLARDREASRENALGAEPRPAEVQLDWKPCPTCGDTVTTRARICRHCGAHLAPSA